MIPGVPEAYYEASHKHYLVKDDQGNWMSISPGDMRTILALAGFSKTKSEGAAASMADVHLLQIAKAHHVVYAGPLAGYDIGMCNQSGYNVLVTHQRTHITPRKGDWSVMRAIFENAFIDGDINQLGYFYGWLKIADQTLNSPQNKGGQKSFTPGPALVLAGAKNSCKTLIAKIITAYLGGRRALPYRYMMGKTEFNKDLTGAEHLVIDDEVSSTDLRTRKNFGFQIKHLLFGDSQSGHGKSKDAFTLYPFFRLTILVNDEPEALMILPPIDDSLEDKIMILHAVKKTMPMPASTQAEREILWNKLMEELPAFLHWIRNEFVVPSNLHCDRTGIMAFKHPRLMETISNLTPEDRLLTLIDDAIFGIGDREDWTGTANELTKDLLGTDFAHDAKAILSWAFACGTYLGRLARKYPDRVIYIPKGRYRGWRIVGPVERGDHTPLRSTSKADDEAAKKLLDAIPSA